jgi:sugar fermentation stimulation protein A
MVHNGSCWIGVNTSLPNHLTEEAIRGGVIKELQGYEQIRREVKYGKNSRIDLLLSSANRHCYIEAKNVTLVENNYYQFPDSVTDRGRKHLKELINMAKEGHRAVMLFVIQRSDGGFFKTADHIDPEYGKSLCEAMKNGVEVLAYRADVSPVEVKISEAVGVNL